MAESYDVVVIGAGQAGLTASRALTERGLGHVVLERDRIGERWRTSRWDSLMFQFPNSVLALPGLEYAGDDPSGFSHHTEVLRVIESYAELIAAPVRERTAVTSLERLDGRWHAETTGGPMESQAVVIATGPFQTPRIPALSAQLPRSVTQLHSVEYRKPDLLPPGGVLVVGSGASGTQIAEELVEAGRDTYLSVSRHRRVPRRYAGRDVTDWLIEMGVMDRTRETWADGRMPPTVLVTGVGGGHDVDVRAIASRGARVLGSLVGVEDDRLTLAANAEEILAAADTMYDDFVAAVDKHLRSSGIDVPEPRPQPPRTSVSSPATLSLTEAGISSVVWSTGFDFDYGWLHAACLDATGAPVQSRGVTEVPGLYFLGLHWMHTFKSGTFMGIGDDAAYVADHLAHHLRMESRP